MEPDDAQTVIEIFPELALGDPLFEVGVRGGEHANVHGERPRFSDGHDFLLEKTQELRLNVEGEVADFVEEQRAAGGRPDETLLIGDRAGEASSPMAEQLAIGQLARRCGAAYGQGTSPCCAASRNGSPAPRGPSGAAFARDQHGQVVPLHALNLIGKPVHRRAGADESGQERLERSLC